MTNNDFGVNPAELLDIVDENDNVIGTMSFDEAHAQGKLHRFCRVLLMNDDGGIILQERSKGISYAGKLDAPGGHVTSGKTYKEMAVIEVQEEMGVKLNADDLTLLGRISDRKNPSYENMIGMAYSAIHNGPYAIEEGEVSSLKVLTKEQLIKGIQESPASFSPKLIETVRVWMDYNNKMCESKI